MSKASFGGGCSYEGCILQAGDALWAAGYSGNANLGINSTAGANNLFQRVLGQSGVIEDWNCYGQGTSAWGVLAFCMMTGALMPAENNSLRRNRNAGRQPA